MSRWRVVVIVAWLAMAGAAQAAVWLESEIAPGGLGAQLVTSPALPVVGATTTLESKVTGVTSRQPELVGVRSDLQNFFHLTAPAKYQFPAAGLYQVWSGVNGDMWFKHPVVIVGDGALAKPKVNLSRETRVNGQRVSLVASSTLLVARLNELVIKVGTTTPASTLIAIKDDLSLITKRTNKDGRFALTFSEAGYYKLFVEWPSHNLASFWVKATAPTVKASWLQRIFNIFSPSH